MLREGMFIADRYEILEKIGSGGMSDVYRAKCHKLNRYVAIKVLKSEYSEDKTFVSKFRAEAQSAAGLMHSNIVNVYDVGEENGVYYIVMELVEGITLKKYIDKKGKLGIREAVSIAIQVAQGIEAAHKHNIVHRDIKPQNIIISKEGKVKVTDFGIARAATSNTINSVVMGSVHYISPEQARGGYSDEKSDIYSFGIALFEMLTGKVPFEGDTTVSIALQHIQNDMISPKTYLPEIPVSVEKIVLKCTQKKTERRYQNMSDLIADLKRSLVTPDEDFVVIGAALTSDAPTKMIAPEEMNEITQKMSQGLNVINPNQQTDEYSEDLDEDIPDDSYDEIIEDDIVDEDIEENDDNRAAKKLDKIITILGIIVAVVIVIITIVVITKVSKMLKKPEEQKKPGVTTEQVDDDKIRVPALLGKTYAEAEKMLNDVGLGIKKVEEFSNEYEAGIIFKQSMDAGDFAPEHTQIIVTISKGPNIFKLENIVGKKQDEALKYLDKESLKYELKYTETEDDSLVGVVAESNPVQGTEVKSGDTIVLTIYQLKGQQNEVVPDLEGKTESEARREIESLGFKIGDVTYEYSDEIEKDKVISQSGPKVGEEAPLDTVIHLVVSNGKKEIKVPEIVGKTEAEANKLIEDAKLAIGEVTKVYSDTVPAGTVISIDNVKSGDDAKAGDKINFTVSLGEEPESIPKVVDKFTVSEVTSKLDSVDIDRSKKVVFKYVLEYEDVDGRPASLQIAAAEYANYYEMQEKAPYNIDSEISTAKKGPAKLTLTVTYYMNVPEETTPAETEPTETEAPTETETPTETTPVETTPAEGAVVSEDDNLMTAAETTGTITITHNVEIQ